MDLEVAHRTKLIEYFGTWFTFDTLVCVWHPVWRRNLQVDLIGVPNTGLTSIALAFEVKNKGYWKLKFHVDAIKQAADYVGCVVRSGIFRGMVINSSFIFRDPSGPADRSGEELCIRGATALGAKLRVGVATVEKFDKPNQRSVLYMPNHIWYSDSGFNAHAEGILLGKRPLAATSIGWAEIERRMRDLDCGSASAKQ